jgi:hypothetical protein
VTDVLRYNAPVVPAAGDPANTQTASSASSSRGKKAAKVKAPPASPQTSAAPPPNDLIHALGRFFKRLFGGG